MVNKVCGLEDEGMKKMRNSDQIVISILGNGMDRWFQIKARQAATSGKPTFSLVYVTFRGGEIPLLIDKPLAKVREALEEFKEHRDLSKFYYVREFVEEELGGSLPPGVKRF